MSVLGGLDQMLADMKSGIFDFTENGKCSNCGNCCSNILPVSKKEIKSIRKYIEKHDIREQICCYPTTQPTIDMLCPFRDEGGKRCLIYPVRPAICRDFQCDKPRKKIEANKALYHGRIAPDSRRET